MLEHLFNHWDELLTGMFTGATVYGFASYMARTIPPVTNRWAAWLVGGLQYVLANADKGAEQVKFSKTQQVPVFKSEEP